VVLVEVEDLTVQTSVLVLGVALHHLVRDLLAEVVAMTESQSVVAAAAAQVQLVATMQVPTVETAGTDEHQALLVLP